MFADLKKAFSLVMKTKAYLLYRAAVYGVITSVWVLILLVVWGALRAFGGWAALITFVLAAGGMGLVWPLVREYALYLLRAGHVALVTELLTNGELPQGQSQTVWAKERVMHYFKEISVLALVDQFVKGIINALNRTLFNIMNFMPTEALKSLAKFLQAVVRNSLTYVDEAILAYTFKTRNENVYDAAKTGIVIYAQSWKPIVKTAVMLTIFSYVFAVLVALLLMLPLAPLAMWLRSLTDAPAIKEQIGVIVFVVALLLGTLVKWILFDPVACTTTIAVFLREAETAQPSPEWEAKIEKVSAKFVELKNKAMDKMRSRGKGDSGSADMALDSGQVEAAAAQDDAASAV